MTRAGLAHTSALSAVDRKSARDLLWTVFDDMTEHEWEHEVGGLHAVVGSGGAVAHAALVQRRLLHGGLALRAATWRGWPYALTCNDSVSAPRS